MSLVENFSSDWDEIKTAEFLSVKTQVQGKNGVFDLSQCDFKKALHDSNLFFSQGLPDFIKSGFNGKKYSTALAKKMATQFVKGGFCEPDDVLKNEFQKGLKDSCDKAIRTIFNLIINNFLRENGFSTEVLAHEVAAHLVTRARLIQIKKEWQG